ncbi:MULTISPECIES: 4'-phosphopantetheinyl transferase superfamily protein [Streptomyces]|uniref:4'-phosphopantetheinyl transferase superfamily protein n=1 Tax=Streptomyces lycii TaxID=2654337 RepID=A0ABQ7FBU8_9ACTN|nr:MULTISPECIES: 4'-phosphopantetheinyl transferase superfamily protein [Streptomyces]KAF4406451.1 4'-phosphopantetheinyl transferase superfamily protein [Streptomyces lycii]PGH50114.1 4-phosphopantetheinyl transferase [Streptomyces sp. Ru87]
MTAVRPAGAASPRWLLPAGPPPPRWDPAGGTALWLVCVPEHDAARGAGASYGLLDAGERRRAAAFVRDVDRRRYRVAHVALRRLLGGYLGRDAATVVLRREPCPGCGGPHGRPAVPGTPPPLHFSLSHAGDLVLIAVAAVPVGADVEALPSASTAADVAAALHPGERAELAALPAADRPAGFARCWTRKEAYLKGTGTGLAEDPSVTYVGAGPEPARLPHWDLADVPVPAGYAAACAVRRTGGAAAGPGA